MYKNIDGLVTVPDESIVRRYMSFSKFIAVLETKSLFFPSLELLANEDKFEGLFNLTDHPDLKIFNQVSNDFQKNYRRHCFVNCWSWDNSESFALWKIYLSNTDDGIAIESNFGKLKESFHHAREDIYIGQVKYAPSSYAGNRFFTCTTKRSLFAYEKEIRVIYEKVPVNPSTGKEDVSIVPSQPGYSLPIDLSILFGRVIVSPSGGSWFHELVKLVLSKYGYEQVEVVPSILANEPL